MNNASNKDSPSWSLEQALGILAVDNIPVSEFTRELLLRHDRGELTSEQVRDAIRQRAQSYASSVTNEPKKAALTDQGQASPVMDESQSLSGGKKTLSNALAQHDVPDIDFEAPRVNRLSQPIDLSYPVSPPKTGES